MTITTRSLLEALGLREDAAKDIAMMVDREASRCEDPDTLLVVTTCGIKFTSAATPDLSGDTPCLVFEIGKEKDS